VGQNWFIQGLIVLAICWFLRDKVPYIGKLPGDIFLELGNLRLFLPITSGLLLSLAWSFLRSLSDGR
jgi:hypothetical protein